MEKVIVIGCPGSGKSTFSRALQKVTGLPLHHLDLLYWNPDKTTVPEPDFQKRLQAVLETNAWIVDGNYGSTMEQRLQACDTVFFLDYPVELCLHGIRERSGKPRPDMPWAGSEENEDLLELVRNYGTDNRPVVLELLKRYAHKNCVVFRSRAEADAYLASLQIKRQP